MVFAICGSTVEHYVSFATSCLSLRCARGRDLVQLLGMLVSNLGQYVFIVVNSWQVELTQKCLYSQQNVQGIGLYCLVSVEQRYSFKYIFEFSLTRIELLWVTCPMCTQIHTINTLVSI